MTRGAGRIRHVVQTVEECDEVVIAAPVRRGVGNLEADIVDTDRRRTLAGRIDRWIVVVDADELRLRKGLRHKDCARTVPAADIGGPATGGEFLDDAFEGR